MPFAVSAKDHNAEVIDYKIVCSVNQNILTERDSVAIRINNSDGAQYSVVNISCKKEDKLSDLEARIIDKDGKTVRKLRRKEITISNDNSDDALYEDVYNTKFFLNYDNYPYTLVYSYKIEHRDFLEVADWTPILDTDIPTLKASLKVMVPADYKISYVNWNTDTMIADTAGAEREYTWKAHYINFLDPETYAPPLDTYIPQVVVVPMKFVYDIPGSLKSWRDFGNWQYSLLQGLNMLPEGEKDKIQSLIKGVKNKREEIRILYHYLQDETRYIAVFVKTGRLIPYPASYVAEKKYGDCKALTNYFKSILDFVGIKSYYTNIYAGGVINKIDTRFPSVQFNHVILYIPDSTEPVWLDCTSKYAFDYLGTFTQGRYALMVDKDSSRLIRTPAMTPDDVLETRNISIRPGFGGSVLAKFDNRYKGYSYEMLEGLKTSFNPTDNKRILNDYIAGSGFEMTGYSIKQSGRDAKSIQFLYDATSTEVYNQYGNDILVEDIPFPVPGVDDPKDRKLPVQINYPINRIDSIYYEIPFGDEVSSRMDNVSVKTQFGEYSRQFFKKDQKILVVNKLLILSGSYPLSVYKKFYQFLQTVAKHEGATILVFSKVKP